MKFQELNEEQLMLLKQNYLCIVKEHTSWEELANANKIVSTEELETLYKFTEFSEDDFGYCDERRSYSY